MNSLLLRAIQCIAWMGCAFIFDQSTHSDPVGLTSQAWFLGVLICGFGGMFAITYLIVLLLHGPKAARSIQWY